MKLKNKVVIVTGASRGIGRSTAERFLIEGAKVVVANRKKETGIKVVEDLNENNYLNDAIYIKADVSIKEEVENLVNETINTYSTVDILVNNAAMTGVAAVHESTVENWNKIISTTLSSVFLCSKYVLPIMLKNSSGVIINIASNVYFLATKRSAAYVAAKSGVVGLTKQMALDYCSNNIRVNAICPGWTDTEMADEYISSREDPDTVRESIYNTIPIKKMAKSEEVASVALFLAF